MKRLRTEAAETRRRIVRAAADRFQREGIDARRGPMKWNALAEQSSSLCRALSVIGDRWTLLILNQCFLKLRRYGGNPVFAGLVETAARREAEENGPSWGAEESAFTEVEAGSPISPAPKRPAALFRPACPRSRGKCLPRL